MERKGPNLPGPEGSPLPTTEIGFRTSGEYWNEYLVDDGSVIRLKVVVTDVMRVDGAYDPEGNPMYVTKSTNIMTVSTPEEIRRQQ